MKKDFEVGKFYKLQVSSFSSKLIPALCIRVLKRKIDFLFLSKDSSGKITKGKASRCLQKATEYNHARAYVADLWSCIAPTLADMETEKPKLWDSVEE